VRIALHLKPNVDRLAQERHRAFIITLVIEIECEIFQRLRSVGMHVAQKLAPHCQCFTKHCFGSFIVAVPGENISQVVNTLGDLGMYVAKECAADSQGFANRRLCLGVFGFQFQHVAEIIETLSDFGMVIAADNLNIEVGPGELVGIVGANGSGKTTFLNLITGYLRPERGRILVMGRDTTGLPPRSVTKLGVARSFQIPQLYTNLSVLEGMLLSLAAASGEVSPPKSASPNEPGPWRRTPPI